MKPTRCTLLLSIFISTSLDVSGNCMPIIRRTYCIYATLVFFTLYGWLSGLLVGMRRRPADQSVTHTEWKIPVSHRYRKFSWWWAYSCPKHVVKFEMNVLRSSVHLVGFIWNGLHYSLFCVLPDWTALGDYLPVCRPVQARSQECSLCGNCRLLTVWSLIFWLDDRVNWLVIQGVA